METAVNIHIVVDIVAKWVALGLEITSGYGNKTVYGPKSDCSYYTDISK